MSCHKVDYSLLAVVSVNIAEFEVAVVAFSIRCRIRMTLFAEMLIEAVGVVAFAVGVVVAGLELVAEAVDIAVVVVGVVAAFVVAEPALELGPWLSALLLSSEVQFDIAVFHTQAC